MRKLFAAIMLVSVLVGCDKNDGRDGHADVSKSAISAKWIISGNSEYESLEFNESGNYIVTSAVAQRSSESATQFGTYAITDNTLTLNGFGSIAVSEITSSSIRITLTRSGSKTPVTVTGSKAAEITGSVNTDLLCRTWESVSCDGEPLTGLTTLISKAGTYLVYTDEGPQPGFWKWKDAGQTTFYYSAGAKANWSDDMTDDILELTATTLKVLDKFKGVLEGEYVEYESTWVFKAVEN